jgi:3-methyladenine DNA glycosylase AlkD
MSKNLIAIQGALKAAAKDSHVQFMSVMVPGQQKVYGVKTPVMNELVKKFKHGSFELAEELWASGAFEEKVIANKIMEKMGKKDPERLLKLFSRFSKTINNWAECDGLGMQFLRGIVKTHADEIFNLAGKMNRSKDPWQRRLSLVMVEWYARDKSRQQQIRDLISNLKDDPEYYVKKAVDWLNREVQSEKQEARR